MWEVIASHTFLRFEGNLRLRNSKFVLEFSQNLNLIFAPTEANGKIPF